MLISCLPTKEREKIYYYLYTCEERDYMKKYYARKYTVLRDGKILEEVFRYYQEIDSMHFQSARLFRKEGKALISYTSDHDLRGQVYLKVQLDTSFFFKYEDEMVNRFYGSEFRYLGKDTLQRNGIINEFYKFQENRNETIVYVYLSSEFVLERFEFEDQDKKLHFKMDRIDSIEVPYDFRKRMEN